MKHSVQHDVGQEKAIRAAKAALAAYQERFGKYDPKADWIAENRAHVSFTAKGITLKGTIEITPKTIEMDLDVPFVLRPFKGAALGKVDAEIGKWIAKARQDEV